ncbi:MAG: ligand-binding sensor domain-containing protein, partial [Wenzhouxiangella sp.]
MSQSADGCRNLLYFGGKSLAEWIGLLALPWISMAASAAHVGHTPLDELHQQVWTTRDGIPHNTVNAIAQTPDGYLWFATWEGVVRFNGHRFRIFDRSPETGLPDSGILSLSVGPNGRLLMAGARGGVVETDGRHWQAQPQAETMVLHAIKARDRSVWLATQGAGIIRRKFDRDGSLTGREHYLPGASAYQLVEDEQGRVWAGTSDGLVRIEDGETTRFGPEDGLPSGPVFSLLSARDGDMFVGTESGLYAGSEESF